MEGGGGGPWSHVIVSPIPQQPKPTKGRMRIHCLENVDKALQFLKEQKVHLENMGSHDIVDGNHRLTLGLVWTIILRFQVPRHSVLQSVPHTSVPYREQARPVHGMTDKNPEGLEPPIAVYGCCVPRHPTRRLSSLHRVETREGVVQLLWQVPCGLVCLLATCGRTTCWSTRDWRFYKLDRPSPLSV